MKHLLWMIFRRYAYAIWLGAAVDALGTPWYCWQYYLVVIPVVLLVQLIPNEEAK